MSKRHEKRRMQRALEGKRYIRAPRYIVRSAKIEKHDYRRARTGVRWVYYVLDRATEKPASESFDTWAEAEKAAGKLNGPNPKRY